MLFLRHFQICSEKNIVIICDAPSAASRLVGGGGAVTSSGFCNLLSQVVIGWFVKNNSADPLVSQHITPWEWDALRQNMNGHTCALQVTRKSENGGTTWWLNKESEEGQLTSWMDLGKWGNVQGKI